MKTENKNETMKQGMKNKWYRFEAVVKGMREPMVDWYKGQTEAEARKCWHDDAHLYGLPMDKTTVTVRETTPEELRAISKCCTPKSEIPNIAEAIKQAVNKYGSVDDVPLRAYYDEFGLSKETADKVTAIIREIDQFDPTVDRVMREIGRFSS